MVVPLNGLEKAGIIAGNEVELVGQNSLENHQVAQKDFPRESHPEVQKDCLGVCTGWALGYLQWEGSLGVGRVLSGRDCAMLRSAGQTGEVVRWQEHRIGLGPAGDLLIFLDLEQWEVDQLQEGRYGGLLEPGFPWYPFG
jgi:hypothetical protein